MSAIPRIINMEETIGKTVGRRNQSSPLDPVQHSIKRAKGWCDAFPPMMTPKGVYRFKTHEEAEQWTTKNTRKPKTGN
ncbi:MAG: hypothetical protein NWT08_00655 [Akkermansiaceae bacterium]|jgi:hypothetical protein|nr:hypothetical protein [Akkermansiaceae bacterium]MDP4648115.1 hypothetical protein [Akkermansiaceae bacterium]MDP4719671.1 hypothetical protein [Akkermansiaceae bacterium]MDP4780615.1 hypothetical protein [Akkermansiaceae bacterium]MDP4846842.1 hypothetical protein [Akkermansiaceae bacterium]